MRIYIPTELKKELPIDNWRGFVLTIGQNDRVVRMTMATLSKDGWIIDSLTKDERVTHWLKAVNVDEQDLTRILHKAH